MQFKYKLILILLLHFLVLVAQQDIHSFITDGYIDGDNTDIEEFSEYINQFLDSQIIWNDASIEQIQILPINIFIKRRLISLKKSNKKYDKWKFFKKDTEFTNPEMEVIKLFFLLNEDELVSGKIYYYSGIKKNDRPEIIKNLSRAKLYHPNGWFLGAVTEQDKDELHIWDYTNISLKSPEIFNSTTGYFGAFRIKWGSGLFFNTNYMNSMNSMAFNNIKPANVRIANYSGSGENQYLFGSAMHIKGNRLSFYPFFSSRKLDCRFENNIVQSIDNSGYHITKMQVENRDKLQEIILGTGITYNREYIKSGLLFFNAGYSNKLADLNNNKKQSGMSFYHNYQKKDFTITGELCYSFLNEFAIVQTAYYRFEGLRFGVSGRYFSQNFYSTTGSMVKTYSGVPQNEKGVYYCMDLSLFNGLKISSFIDFYSRIKPNNIGENIDFGSVTGLNFSKRFYSKWNMNINVKRKSNIQYKQQQIKYKIQFKWTKNFSIISNYVKNIFKIENSKERGMGFQIYIKNQSSNYKTTLGITHYFTSTWNSRVYIYEPGIPYRFSMPALSGTGYNYFITETINFNEIFSFSFAGKYNIKFNSDSIQKVFQAEIQMLVAF